MKDLRKIYNSTSNVQQLQGHRKILTVNLSSPGSNLGTTPETSRKTVPRWPCSGFLSSFPALWHSWSLWVYLGDTQGKNSFSWCTCCSDNVGASVYELIKYPVSIHILTTYRITYLCYDPVDEVWSSCAKTQIDNTRVCLALNVVPQDEQA